MVGVRGGNELGVRGGDILKYQKRVNCVMQSENEAKIMSKRQRHWTSFASACQTQFHLLHVKGLLENY